MRKWPIAVVAMFSVYAAPAIAGQTFQVGSDMAGTGRLSTVIEADGQRVQVVRNANDCAPFESEAVWGRGPGSSLLGYRCYHRNSW